MIGSKNFAGAVSDLIASARKPLRFSLGASSRRSDRCNLIGTCSRAVFASAFVVATTLSAAALDPSSEKVGRWTVWSNADFKNPAACAAIVSNGKEDLRLFTDGKT